MNFIQNKQAEEIACPSSEDIFINHKGQVQPQHTLELEFDLNEYVMLLREKKLQWRHIYWKLWKTTIMLFCST